MGQVPLDLPDPLLATPLSTAKGADDLLSQMAGDEIDRLLAEADQADGAGSDDEEAAAKQAVGTGPSVEGKAPGMPPQSSEGERRETAVSSFVAEGDPALEAELDNLLANLNGAPVALSDTGIVIPPGGTASPAATDGTGAAEPEAPADDVPRGQSPVTPKEQRAREPGPAARDTAGETDTVLKGELDQVFDKMTASAEPAPIIDSSTTTTPAKVAASIDLLKVLDPIVAKDAAKAEEEAAAEEATHEPQAPPAEERVPVYVLILEWINAPLGWLSPEARAAAGKVGILTLINAAAVLLYVLFFRRK